MIALACAAVLADGFWLKDLETPYIRAYIEEKRDSSLFVQETIRFVTAKGRPVFATPNVYSINLPQMPGPARFAVSRSYQKIVLAEFLRGPGGYVLEVTEIIQGQASKQIVPVDPFQPSIVGFDADDQLLVATRMPNPSTWRVWNLTQDRQHDLSSLDQMPLIYQRQYDPELDHITGFSSPHWFGFDEGSREDFQGLRFHRHCTIYDSDDAVAGEYRLGYAVVPYKGSRRYLSPPEGSKGFLTLHVDGSTVRAICFDNATKSRPEDGFHGPPPARGHFLYELSLDSPTITWQKAGPALYSVATPKE